MIRKFFEDDVRSYGAAESYQVVAGDPKRLEDAIVSYLRERGSAASDALESRHGRFIPAKRRRSLDVSTRIQRQAGAREQEILRLLGETEQLIQLLGPEGLTELKASLKRGDGVARLRAEKLREVVQRLVDSQGSAAAGETYVLTVHPADPDSIRTRRALRAQTAGGVAPTRSDTGTSGT